ncbi:MAG: ATP-grasp domain-containing protein [Bacteroidales bacterium]|nr:ATP-grasp domain-containing protein [Bacteroidales bacterium]
MVKRVLVTAIGTMNCTTIIEELRKNKSYYIIGADINPEQYISNSKYVDEFYVFPKATINRENYFEFVKQFCINHNIDIYYCVVDEEVATMSNHIDEFESIGVTLCVANSSAVNLCHNKGLFSDWILENVPDLYIKRYKNYEEITNNDLPIFIKPVEGRASIGCKVIKHINELENYKDHWSDYVVQEYIDCSKIVAVDIVSNLKYNQIELSQRLELLRNSNGCGIAVEIINNPQIREYCIEIVKQLQINGVVNIEFFLTEKGPKIIEINPRIPAGVAYSCMSGLNVVMNALYIAQGEPCVFNPIKVGKHYTKRYETIEM